MQSPCLLVPTDWTDYELIDSGKGEKLERFHSYTLIRPDPRILWQKSNTDLWKHPDARYIRTDDVSGHWNIEKDPPNPWRLTYKTLTFTLRPTEFKHVGVFPEQAVNWDWLTGVVRGRAYSVLNLFAYTGGNTLAAASSGAHVTHVDSMKQAIDWANENAKTSRLSDTSIRWILDDAYKFVVKEGRRGKTYDGIIMDPPRFGRGSQGEVWKIGEDLPKLFDAVKKILSPTPKFVLVNAYTADLSPLVLKYLTEELVGSNSAVEHGELALEESHGGRLLPCGIFARWKSDE